MARKETDEILRARAITKLIHRSKIERITTNTINNNSSSTPGTRRIHYLKKNTENNKYNTQKNKPKTPIQRIHQRMFHYLTCLACVVFS